MIKKYIDEMGVELFLVSVNVRSTSSPHRKQRKVSKLKTYAEAKKLELQLIRECERELVQREARGKSWGFIVDEFENYLQTDQTVNLHANTRLDYIATVRRHCTQWNDLALSDIGKSEVRELFAQLHAKGLSIGHQKIIKQVIQRIYSFAESYGHIKNIACPAIGYQFPKEEEKKPEILTIHEIKALLEKAKAMNHEWYPVWAMALLTGMRNGELYALLWDDVDLENKAISLTKSYNTRTRSIKSTKAGCWRTIPISSELEALIKELKAETRGRRELLPRLPGWEKGLQAKILRNFCEGMGLTSIKFHTLRACFATQLIRQGVPPIQIQKICGWRDLETMQRYVRLAGIEIAGATESLKILPEPELMAKVVNLFTAK